MAKCISCNKPKAEFKHQSGGKVCSKCIGGYFTCTDCGTLFNRDDFVDGDQGNGFCKECQHDK